MRAALGRMPRRKPRPPADAGASEVARKADLPVLPQRLSARLGKDGISKWPPKTEAPPDGGHWGGASTVPMGEPLVMGAGNPEHRPRGPGGVSSLTD